MKYHTFVLLCAMAASVVRAESDSSQGTGNGYFSVTRMITMNQAVQASLSSNFGLKSDSLEIAIHSGNLQQAKLPENPEIVLESENTRYTDSEPGKSTHFSIDIEQSFNPIARWKRSDVVKSEFKVARTNYQLQKQELIAEVKKRFVTALAQQEVNALSDSILILLKKVHMSSVNQAIAGKVPFSDTLKTSAEFEIAKIQSDRVDQKQADAFQDLALMWGSSQIDFTCLKDEESSEFFLPDTSVLLTNLSNSPQMAIAHAELNRKSAELAFEKADWIPSIRAGVGIGIGNEAEELSPRASLSFSIPLINWKQGATEAARHGVSQAEARRDAIRIRIYNDVLNTYRNAARLQKEILKFKNTILPQFKEILDASSTAYISGKTGILSLIDAQRNYIEVSREIVEINHEYRHSLIDLERYRITN